MEGGSAFAQFIPLILIFAIMYFLLIRPQQRKLKAHRTMVENLRRGDQVITQGGLIGKVSKVKEDDEVEVELARGHQGAGRQVDHRAGRLEDRAGRRHAQGLSRADGPAPITPALHSKAPTCFRSICGNVFCIWGLVALGILLGGAERVLWPGRGA